MARKQRTDSEQLIDWNESGDPAEREPEYTSEDSVGMYLREVGMIPLLSAAEEVALARDFESGRAAQASLETDLGAEERQAALSVVARGEAARQKLIESNLRLVISIARRYNNRGVPLSDLIEEGNIGLMRAVEKFDYHKGFRFSTYATWWIRQAVSRGLAGQSRVVRVPIHVSEQMAQLSRSTIKLSQELGREPTTDELAADTGLRTDVVRDTLRASLQPISIQQPFGKDGDGTLGDLIEDSSAREPVDEAARQMMREQVWTVLGDLDTRERRVLALRYGLEDDRVRTLDEVGKVIGLTRERIRQIEKDAFAKLRQPGRSDILLALLSA